MNQNLSSVLFNIKVYNYILIKHFQYLVTIRYQFLNETHKNEIRRCLIFSKTCVKTILDTEPVSGAKNFSRVTLSRFGIIDTILKVAYLRARYVMQYTATIDPKEDEIQELVG
jgi:hypothetical protein